MNTMKFNVTIDSFDDLTPIGTNTYQMVARLKKMDGTPLNSSRVANVNPLTVTTTDLNFDVFIPIENATYSIPQFLIELYGNTLDNCCFRKVNYTLNNQYTNPIEVSVEGVVISELGSPTIFLYEPSNGTTTELFDAEILSTSDIAHTGNKLFVYQQFYVNPDFVLRIKEYNITLNPFNRTFVRNYDLSNIYDGAGLCAESDTVLYIAGTSVYKITLSGTTATPSLMFALPAGYQCTGDLIFDASTNLFLMSYDKPGDDYRIGVFQANGTLVRSAAAPTQGIFGIYQFEGVTYIIDKTGQIYTLNLTTLVSTIGVDLPLEISGASQIPSNISIPA